MAFRTDSRHYVWSSHCVVVSLVWTCSCFILLWIVLTSTESSKGGGSLAIHKLLPKKTLPTSCGETKTNTKAKVKGKIHLNLGKKDQHVMSLKTHTYGQLVSEPLVRVLRLVDGEQNPMGYIYEAMNRAKKAIQHYYGGDRVRYDPIWEIIDWRWNNQLHQPIHAAGYYLNPKFFYFDHFTDTNGEVMEGLSTCIEKMTPGVEVRDLIIAEVQNYKHARGRLFSSALAIRGRSTQTPDGENGADNEHIFHNQTIFLQDYKEMKKKFKIYAYPHKAEDDFANIFLPVDFEPSGNYASESYFKKALMQSHFITNDPTEADLFFLPFSVARLRHDSRVKVGGIQDFIKSYIATISQKYPYWNRTNGADHFYVACHSAGRTAMDKAEQVKLNAIQVVCSSSYFVPGYVAHKDASLPQIWPRQGNSEGPTSIERSTLAFFAGGINSPVRAKLLEVWKNDSEISVHFGRLPTPYSEALLKSKFCLHVKGFEVNTARIGDALYYGCVPVIIANHYDLPFNDVLNWKSFSLVVATLDIPLLKDVLHSIGLKQYNYLKKNALKVRKHFQWHMPPLDYDAFNMVMYELWLRREMLRIPL